MFEQRSEEITRGLYAANSESQYAAIRSNCDFVVLTGSGGGGKSSAMLHAWVSDARNNPNSRGLLLMRNINDFFKAGSVVDNIKKIIPLNSLPSAFIASTDAWYTYFLQKSSTSFV